jgi:hypothetical protein
LRAGAKGEGRPLTRVNALALAGRWYNWFIKLHEGDPGDPKRWKEMGEHFLWNVLYPEAPSSFLANAKADPQWEWTRLSLPPDSRGGGEWL